MSLYLDQYHKEFDDLVDTVWAAYKQKELPFSSKSHLSILYSTLFYIEIPEILSKADIRQQLSLMWLRYIKTFTEAKPNIPIKVYLIRRSLWGLRDWFKTLSKRKLVIPIELTNSEIDFGFSIDLKFLLYGTKEGMLQDLSPYERYLIFLRFKEDKSISEISTIVQKTSVTVDLHLSKVLDKIKQNSKIVLI